MSNYWTSKQHQTKCMQTWLDFHQHLTKPETTDPWFSHSLNVEFQHQHTLFVTTTDQETLNKYEEMNLMKDMQIMQHFLFRKREKTLEWIKPKINNINIKKQTIYIITYMTTHGHPSPSLDERRPRLPHCRFGKHLRTWQRMGPVADPLL